MTTRPTMKKAIGAFEPGRRGRSAIRASLVWGLGFAMGMGALSLGGSAADESLPASQARPTRAAPAAVVARASTPGEACREDEAAWDAVLDGVGAHLELAAQVARLESALAALRMGAIDGPSFVRAAVHAMPEDEIRAVLAATTRVDPARLAAIEDVQAYAIRVADIAMEGLLRDGVEPSDVGDVIFSAAQEGRRADWSTAESFDRGEARLYAFFDTTGWKSGDVMVRWRHESTGEVLLLEEHRVRAGTSRGFVWTRPSRGWRPGSYRVDVYRSDESLGHLASGRYDVR